MRKIALVWTGIAVMCAAGCGAPEPTATGEIERESIGADLDVVSGRGTRIALRLNAGVAAPSRRISTRLSWTAGGTERVSASEMARFAFRNREPSALPPNCQVLNWMSGLADRFTGPHARFAGHS